MVEFSTCGLSTTVEIDVDNWGKFVDAEADLEPSNPISPCRKPFDGCGVMDSWGRGSRTGWGYETQLLSGPRKVKKHLYR